MSGVVVVKGVYGTELVVKTVGSPQTPDRVAILFKGEGIVIDRKVLLYAIEEATKVPKRVYKPGTIVWGVGVTRVRRADGSWARFLTDDWRKPLDIYEYEDDSFIENLISNKGINYKLVFEPEAS